MLMASTNQNGTGNELVDEHMKNRIRKAILFAAIVLVLVFFGPRLWVLGASAVAAGSSYLARKRAEVRTLQARQDQDNAQKALPPAPAVVGTGNLQSLRNVAAR